MVFLTLHGKFMLFADCAYVKENGEGGEPKKKGKPIYLKEKIQEKPFPLPTPHPSHSVSAIFQMK